MTPGDLAVVDRRGREDHGGTVTAWVRFVVHERPHDAVGRLPDGSDAPTVAG